MRPKYRTILYSLVLIPSILGISGVLLRRVAIGLTMLCIAGCTTLPVEERENRRTIDNLNWEVCQLAYSGLGKHTISKHAHRRGREHRPYEVKEDLYGNNCRSVLRKYWTHYD